MVRKTEGAQEHSEIFVNIVYEEIFRPDCGFSLLRRVSRNFSLCMKKFSDRIVVFHFCVELPDVVLVKVELK